MSLGKAKPSWVRSATSQSEEYTFISQAPAGMAQIGLDGAWLLVNDRYCQMLGYSEAELRRTTLQDLTYPDDWNATLAGRNQLLAGEISFHTMEKRYIRKDGTLYWGRLNRSLMRDHDGVPVCIIAVVEDITEKIQAESALRESERRLRLAQSAAHVGVWDCDLRSNLTVISEEYARMHGLEPDHPPLTHEEWLTFVHPADRERVEALLKESMEQTHVWDHEFRIVWPDGSVHWLLGKGEVFLDESGQPARMAGVNLDITERKRAEHARKRVDEALRESEERFRRVFEEGPLGLALVGRDYRFEKVNSALCQMLGYSEQSLVQMSFVDITHPDDLGTDVELAERLFRGEIPSYKLRKRYLKKNGEILWIDLTGSVIRNREGEPIYGFAMIEDINDVKRAQEIQNQLVLELGASRDEIRALAANLVKAQEEERRRVSRELHDQICQQLASLAIDIGSLAAGPPPENAQDRLKQIRTRVVKLSEQTRHMAHKMHSSVLDDLGLLAAIEELCSHFTELHPDIALGFEGHGLPASLPSEVASCVYSVAKETLQNIAKHSSAGCVSVDLGFKNGVIALRIKDDGAGFDSKAARGQGGLGLIGMEERARLVNGKLAITAHGTQTALEVPLPDASL